MNKTNQNIIPTEFTSFLRGSGLMPDDDDRESATRYELNDHSAAVHFFCAPGIVAFAVTSKERHGRKENGANRIEEKLKQYFSHILPILMIRDKKP
jgi:hypothetical protein